MVRRTNDWPRYLALSIGVAVIGFGIAVLIAWHVHFIPLIQVAPGQPPTTRQAASCYVLLGAALSLLATGHRRVASVCAAIVFLLTVVIGLEYALDRDLGVDHLLGSGYITEGAEPPGRMSPIAALSYFLSSVPLLAISIPRLSRHPPPFPCLLTSFLISLASLSLVLY